MSLANFSKGPDGVLIYNPKACETEPTSKGNSTKWLEVKHKVKDYKPAEIIIKVTKNMGKIEGNQKTKFSSKSFYKEFNIPKGVNIEQLDISLSANGTLSIFAPIGNGLNASGTVATQVTTQSQNTVQSKSKQQESKVSQIERNKAVSSTTETTRKIKQEIVSEFSSDELNNSRIEDITKEIQRVEQGNTTKKFETRINVKEYSAENIQVKISKQVVVVSGKIVTASKRKEFIKKFSIPSGVEPGSITNSLDTTTGILTISAPVNETQSNQICTRDTNVSTTQKITTKSLQQSINTQQQQITGQEQIQRHREISQTQQQQVSQIQQNVTDSSTQSTSTVIRTTKTSQRIIERECTLDSTFDLDNQLQAIPDSICENVSEQCLVRDGDAFEVNIELPDFAPEDIQIRVTKTTVTIIGRRDIIERNRVSTEEIFKKFTIPYGIRPEDITSTLQPNGVLRITNTSTRITTQQQALKNKGQQVITVLETPTPNSPTPAFSQRQNEEVGKVEPIVNLTTDVNNEELRSHEDLTNAIQKVEQGNNMEVNLNVSDFNREEVNVKIYKRVVVIEARKKTTTTIKSLLKKLTIPDGVRPEQIKCNINPSGILTITAPVEKVLQQQPIHNITEYSAPKPALAPTVAPETRVPETGAPDTRAPEARAPAARVSETRAPEARAPEVRAPEARTPEARAPEAPWARAPEARAPEARAPEARAQEARAPESPSPKERAPEERAPESRTPNSPAPTLPQRPNEDVGKVEPTVDLTTEVNNEELTSHEDLTNVIQKVEEGNKIKVDLNVSDFNREEVNVKIYKRVVIIEARKKTTTTTKSLLKKLTIPEGVRPEQIKCDINPSGILTITAPVEEVPQQQPIQITTEYSAPTPASTPTLVSEAPSPKAQRPDERAPQERAPELVTPNSPAAALSQRPNEDVGKVEPTVDLTTEVNNEELTSHEDLTNVIKKVEKGNKIEVNLNVSDFNREEVNVKIYNRVVIIEARKKTNTTTKSLLKKLTIPEGVRPEQIKCDINPSGILTITAPVEEVLQQQPIQITTEYSTPTPASTPTLVSEAPSPKPQAPGERAPQEPQAPESLTPNSPAPALSQRLNEDIGKVEPTVDLTTEVNNEELTSHEDLTNVIQKVGKGNKIEVNLNVSDFNREEVNVKIYKRVVIIEARKKTTTTTKSLLKKLTIPEGVRPEQIKCDINPSGILIITAPVEEVLQQQPIQITTEYSTPTSASTPTLVSEAPSPKPQAPGERAPQEPQAPESLTPNSPAPALSQRLNEDIGKVEPTVDLTTEVNNEELTSHEDLTNVIQKVEKGNKMEVNLNVFDFNREEVNIKIYKRIVIIEARKKSTTTTTTTKSLLKKLTIPEGVRPEQISCDINPSGILTITAPVEKEQQQQQIQNIAAHNAPAPASAPTLASDSPSFVPTFPQRSNEDIGKVEPTVDLTTVVNNEELKSHEDLTNVIRTVEEGKKMEVNLNVSNFNREEVNVRIYKRIVIIEARKKTTTTTTTKTLLKKLTIPEGVVPEQISCDINPSGILSITAPVALPQRPNEDVGKVEPIVDLTTEVNNRVLTSHEDLTNVIQTVEEGNKIKVNLNVSDFKREEVKVTIYKRIVIIEARKKTTTTTTTTKSLLKRLTIPDGVRPEQISCDINSSGILTITAPVEKVKKQQQIENLAETRTKDTVQSTTTKSSDLSRTNQQKTTQTTSKKSRSVTLKTSIVSAESLSKYDFENATSTVYEYDPSAQTVFEESVEIKEYCPEDIEIKLAYNVRGFNWVIVEGDQEMTAENGYRSKSFTQMFTVPEGVNLETVNCTLDLDDNNCGLLTCTAPIERK